MKIKLIHKTSDPLTGREAKVYRDFEWQEYRVKHFILGIYLDTADYHDTDKAETINHANAWTAGGT